MLFFVFEKLLFDFLFVAYFFLVKNTCFSPFFSPFSKKKAKYFFFVLEKNFEKITFVIAKRENHYFSRFP